MTNTAAIELKKFDGARYMAPDGSVYAMEKSNYDNYHGSVDKHFVGDTVGDSMLVTKDLHDVKVKIFHYDSIFDRCNIPSCLLLQHKIALCFEICTSFCSLFHITIQTA